MDDHFCIGHLVENEVHLGLHHGKIAMGAALQDIFPADLLQVVHAARVDPDVERENGTEPGENFFRLPSLALLVDDIALQEHAAAHR